MSFFQKMGNAFSRFIYGRNGVDGLGLFGGRPAAGYGGADRPQQKRDGPDDPGHGKLSPDGVDPVPYVFQESPQAPQRKRLVPHENREPSEKSAGPQQG